MQPNMYVYITATIQEHGTGQSWFRPKPDKEKQWEMIIETVQQLPEVRSKLVKSLTCSIVVSQLQGYSIYDLRNYCDQNPGNVTLQFRLHDEIYQNNVVLVSSIYRISINRKLYDLLQQYKADDILDYSIELY